MSRCTTQNKRTADIAPRLSRLAVVVRYVTSSHRFAANDVLGRITSGHGYNALNRLLSSVDRLTGVTQYHYDPNDRLMTVQAANGSPRSSD